jgi:hypothetical protein
LLIIQKIFAAPGTNKFTKQKTGKYFDRLHEFSRKMIAFLEQLIPSVPDLLPPPSHSKETKHNSPLVQFLRVGRRVFSAQQLYEESTFDVIRSLLAVFVSKPHFGRLYHITKTVKWLFTFRQFVPAHFREIASALLDAIPAQDAGRGWGMLKVVCPALELASAADLHFVVMHEAYCQLEPRFVPFSADKELGFLLNALLSHLDDPPCRSDTLSIFNRAISGPIASPEVYVGLCRALGPFLAPAVLDPLIERINGVLCAKPERPADYIFALGACAALSDLPGVGLERFPVSAARVLKFAQRSRQPALTAPAVEFAAFFCTRRPDALDPLLEKCRVRLSKSGRDDSQRRVLGVAIVRLGLLAGPDRLWECVGEWASPPQRALLTHVWERLPGEWQLIVRMCGDEKWRAELASGKGRKCLQAALAWAGPGGALEAVRAIVGGRETIQAEADWRLLAAIAEGRPEQGGEIRALLAPRRPADDGVLPQCLRELFGDYRRA